MKLFGEFLIQKNLINEGALLTALFEQIKSQSPICEVVHDNEWVSASDVLKVMNLQAKQKLGFIEAGRELGIWTDSLAAQVEEFLKSSRVPLGQILVKNGSLELDGLTKALDEFLSEVESAPSPPKSIATASKNEPQSNENSLKSAYVEALQDSAKQVIDAFLSDLTVAHSESFKTAADLLHRFVGAARLAELPNSESLLNEFEGVLRCLQKKDISKIDVAVVKQVSDSCKDAVLYVWMFRDGIKAGKTEEVLLEDAETKAKYDRLVSALQIFKFDLEMA